MMESFILHNLKRINGEKIDIEVRGGKIEAVCKSGTINGNGQHKIDCTGAYVSSGWIDLHVHAFPDFSPYGDEIDEIGIKQGVTTIVDAGSCGADHIGDLITMGHKATTNLLAFLNISHIGLSRTDELSDMRWIDREAVLNIRTIAGTQRSIHHHNTHSLLGFIYKDQAFTFSETSAFPIYDRIGAGDAFSSGIIYGELQLFSPEETVAFATTSGMLAHTVMGDTPMSTVDEIRRGMEQSLHDIER